MLLKKYFTYEMVLVSLVFITTLPYSFYYSSGNNYVYSLPLAILSIAYFLICSSHEKKKSIYKNIMIVFLLLTLVTSISYFRYGLKYTSYPNFLANSVCPYLVFLVFYNFSSRNKNDKFVWLCALLYFAIAIYYISVQQGLRESHYMQLNNFYYIVTPLPLLFLNKKLFLRILFLSISIFCVFISLKRSGFFIITLLVLYMLYEYGFGTSLKKKYLFAIIAVFALFLLNDALDNMGFSYEMRMMERLESMESDGGSGRTLLAKESLDRVYEMNFIELIIGKGYSAIDSEKGQTRGFHSFHNDYSEVMYSFGIIGLVTLLIFIWQLLQSCFKVKYINKDLQLPLVSSFIILIVFSFTSSVFHYFSFMLPLFIFWGYISPKLKEI